MKTFEEVYPGFRDDIATTALSQRIPGMDYDDIVQEMTACLWKAVQTWQDGAGASLGAYWWSLWLNRRSDLTDAATARKRARLVPVPFPLDSTYVDRHLPAPPQGSEALDVLIWTLLAHGDPPGAVKALVGVRRYYRAIHSWRTEAVWEELLDSV